ncbi:MAG: bifunctional phosphoribosylaminoimidazolecarboxamide formyltransferase/IMP cyclohydrolase [Alphaproteobacteria bacterium]
MSQAVAPVRRALISVSDKSGLAGFAKGLADQGVALVSTGGTARALRDAGLAVTEVADLTGFPEIMDGRVKTLHPAIHGGLLARRDLADHRAAAAVHGIPMIDLLVVNLYPFAQTVASGAGFDDCVESIDIGGPAMIRAAAKNFGHVGVVVEPADYAPVLAELAAQGGLAAETRLRLAQAAFAHTARYDSMIAGWLAQARGDRLPEVLTLGGRRSMTLRYGENPHQQAALYIDGSGRPGAATARQLQGKALSYNNLMDADAGLALVAEFAEPAVAIIKHATPCGVAIGDDPAEAYVKARVADPISAFGGVVAVNRPLDLALAEVLAQTFLEVVIAPAAEPAALALLEAKPALRILVTGAMPAPDAGRLVLRPLSGGFLAQTEDAAHPDAGQWSVVTRRAPDAREVRDLVFAQIVVKHVKSNAIVVARDGATVGIGAGQMSRLDAARIAVDKAAAMARDASELLSRAVGAVAASDAFFPFADGLVLCAEAGVEAVIQPGGSKRDDEVIAVADERGVAMVTTGTRHFRH